MNRHDLSDDEEDLANTQLEDDVPIRSGMSPFGDTAYQGYQLQEDSTYEEPLSYNEAVSPSKGFELHDASARTPGANNYTTIPLGDKSQYIQNDPHEFLSTPFSHAESDPEAGFRERQQPLRRGHTRRVKLVNGDIFCTDYP